MDENGYYDTIIDFQAVITPSLSGNFKLRITGNFGKKHQDLKDYLNEIIGYALEQQTGL